MASQEEGSLALAQTSSQGPEQSPIQPQIRENKKLAPQTDPEQRSQEPLAPPNPRLQAMAAKKANLEATLASLHAQRSALFAEAKLPSDLEGQDTFSEEEMTKSVISNANAVIKEHIALLTRYNEIKDIGQGLMGLIAEKRGVRIATVMEDFGMGEKD